QFLQSSGQPAPPESAQTFQSRLQSLLLTLIPPSPAAVLRGSRLRGSSRKKNVVLGAESVRVFMGLEADDDRVTVSGQITDENLDANWEGTLLELRRSGARVAVTLVDEDGYFECGPLTTGPADLKISSGQGPIFHIEGLELNPAGE
ncbi:MAG TPA: hypothetical protein VHO69_17635, partial [Phototrophicaceae bacterium]|nr:hypothetical protein [Phototrophicaceae bacterium]